MRDKQTDDRRPTDVDEAFTTYATSGEYRRIRTGRLNRFLSNAEDREDCGQELDLKVYAKLFARGDQRPDFAFGPDRGPSAPYVQRMAANECLDHLRRLGRNASEAGAPDELEADSSPLADPAVPADVERVILEYAGDDPAVARDIHLVMMRAYHHYTYEEMGRMLFSDEVGEVSAAKLADRSRKRVAAAIERLREVVGASLDL